MPALNRWRPGGLLWLPAALALLVWTCRRAPLGVPVVDDYFFLHAARFQPGLDLFAPFGLNPYWRPIGRQLYYGLLGPWMIDHPWTVAVLHLGLLGLLGALLYRVARRWMGPGPAAAVATFPVLAEPARVLVTWPSSAQPLIAMVLATLALHEALVGRRWTAAIAAVLASLSYEQALLVLAPVALLAWRGRAPGESPLAALAPLLALLTLRALGEWVAATRGAGLLGPAWTVGQRGALGPQLAMAVQAQLGLLEVGPGARRALWAAYGLLAALALALGLRPPARGRVGRSAGLVLAGTAWFVAGMATVASANSALCAWRTVMPALGLGLAAGALLAAISPWLPVVLAAVRAAALLLAPVVPPGVEGRLPETTLVESFIRIARLQRVVDSARRELRAIRGSLPPGPAIRYWSAPQLVGQGFAGDRAVKVWMEDSTATWGWLDDFDAPHDAVLAFNTGVASPAVRLDRGALESYRLALAAQAAGDLLREDSLVAAAMARQRARADAFTDELARVGARLARRRGDPARADSLNRLTWRLGGASPDFHAMEAMLALERGDREAAGAAARRCLALAPRNAEALEVLRVLAAEPPARPGP